jgi:predicted ATP-dependent serine protease
MRYCNRCGCPREPTGGRCLECGSPEFCLEPDATHEGWLRRQQAKQASIKEREFDVRINIIGTAGEDTALLAMVVRRVLK